MLKPSHTMHCLELNAQNKKAFQMKGFFEFGGSSAIRTRDQRIKSPLLYQLS